MRIKQMFAKAIIATVACLFLLLQAGLGQAVDTDIYQSNVKQNAYVLMDNSTSMDFGVYESNIDYGAMFDYLFVKDEITDTIMNSDYYLTHHEQKNKQGLLYCNGS